MSAARYLPRSPYKLIRFCVLLTFCSASFAQSAVTDCDASKYEAVLASLVPEQIIVIGDIHGSVEAPKEFTQLVCAAAQERHVLVGLELLEDDTPALRGYLASEGSEEDAQSFLAQSSWRRIQDGRSSIAMWTMIEQLRRFKAGGLRVDVTNFQRRPTERSDSQTPYEKGLAASLLEAREATKPELTLVLVGNVHAMKQTIRFQTGPEMEPMAMHFPQELTLSLVLIHTGGEVWNCLAPDDCGVHVRDPMRLNTAEIPVAGSLVLDASLRSGYDGVINVGSVSASPPFISEP